MRRNVVLHAALLGVLAVAPVAAASGGQQVDPRSMERAARVSNPGPVDGRIVLCSLQPSIKQVFDIAGFAGMFTFAATRDEALAAFS